MAGLGHTRRLNADVPLYLPLIENRTRRRDNGKIHKSLLPLFPGYVAMAMDQDTRSRGGGSHDD